MLYISEACVRVDILELVTLAPDWAYIYSFKNRNKRCITLYTYILTVRLALYLFIDYYHMVSPGQL